MKQKKNTMGWGEIFIVLVRAICIIAVIIAIGGIVIAWSLNVVGPLFGLPTISTAQGAVFFTVLWALACLVKQR